MIDQILAEVLNVEIADVNTAVPKDAKQEDHIYYRVENDYGKLYAINKYEFMHLCKEYIFNSGYWLQQRTNKNKSYIDIMEEESAAKVPMVACLSEHNEADAVINATAWVIANKKIQK